ncbi:Hypothetical protein CINCED_3A006625 [Cinara cedri]|uniref:Transmembrane protein n=1 Tax=Cinara cedri TaxID=506608 RepID=A0A5E4M065_9HEMI|nr:Hypothetical protein CINCED_3A006625 [Cinara cedri]
MVGSKSTLEKLQTTRQSYFLLSVISKNNYVAVFITYFSGFGVFMLRYSGDNGKIQLEAVRGQLNLPRTKQKAPKRSRYVRNSGLQTKLGHRP